MKLFPELELIDSPAERKRIFRSVYRQVHRGIWVWVKIFAIGAVLNIAAHIAVSGLSRYVPISPSIRGGIAGGVGGAILGILLQHLLRKPMQRGIRTMLNEMGTPVCMECGYDLRGQTEPRCPECGTQIIASRD